jgi:hypothetical protein
MKLFTTKSKKEKTKKPNASKGKRTKYNFLDVI